MGTTQLYVYKVWYVGSAPNCHFSFMSCTNSIYTVCHVGHYIKVHQVHIKFWLIMANSASDHSFRHPPFILVMTYCLIA